MTTRTITLCAEHWQLIRDALLDFCDEGPPGEGWKSPGLSSAVAALDAALDEPEPEGLTDEQALADFTSWLVRELPPWHCDQQSVVVGATNRPRCPHPLGPPRHRAGARG